MASNPRRSYNQDEYEPFALHPNKVLLFLLLASLTVLFLGFSFAYIYTRNEHQTEGIRMPLVFVYNTAILLLSSWTMHRANKAYKEDDTTGYQRYLLYTVLLTLIFMAAQFYGWSVLSNTVFSEEEIGNAKHYLYAISALHAAHVVGGVPFLFLFLRTANKRMKDPVSVLVYFSDPEKRMKLKLLTIYWHFLDGLWIFLVFLFLGNALL